MMRIFAAAIVVAGILSAKIAFAASPEYDACKKAATDRSAGLTCMIEENKRADLALEKIYDDVRKETLEMEKVADDIGSALHQDDVLLLEKSHEAFKTYREVACAHAAASVGTGMLSDEIAKVSCYRRLTEERIKLLKGEN